MPIEMELEKVGLQKSFETMLMTITEAMNGKI